MSTIYRKYRPQVFADVTGQEHIIKTITNEVATNQIAHAYLLCGPRGTGKTTLARLLAKAVNCQNKKDGDFEPCNTCSSCQELMGGHSLDIIEVDAASHTGVDNVRENIIENAQFRPTKSKYKVFIIDEVHMLSTSAFNALLKTLEEPPAHAIFILATTEAHKLLPTIISRCQRFNFKKVGYTHMLERLERLCAQEKIKVEKKVLERIINKSDGCVRDAESLLGQILSLVTSGSGSTITAEDAEMVLPSSTIASIIHFIDLVTGKQPAAAIELIQQLITDGVNLEQFAYDSIEALRLVMIIQTSAQTKNINTDYAEADLKSLQKIAEKVSPAQLITIIESLITRHREIKSSPLPQLPLELFAVEFGTKENTNSTPSQVSHSPQQAKDQAVSSSSSTVPPLSEREIERVAEVPTSTTTPSPKENTEIENKESANSFAATSPLTTSNNTPDNQNSFSSAPTTSFTQTITETDSHLVQGETKTTVEDIRKQWDKVIAVVAKTNHSLSFILKMSELKFIKDGHLHISVPYSFHKDKISEVKTRVTIEKAMTDLFAEPIGLVCEIAEQAAQPASDEDPELAKLAADFGGELA